MIFARKMPEIYINIARKIFSRILGGTCPPAPRLLRLCGSTKTNQSVDVATLIERMRLDNIRLKRP